MESPANYQRNAKQVQPNVPAQQNQKLSTHKVFDEQIIVQVNEYITKKMSEGLVIPPEYNVSNALTSAKLHLLNLKDDSGKLIVDQCTLPSVVNSLTTMVVSGYNVAKKQCAFIKYGDVLTCQPEYFGNLMVAKRDANVKDVNAQCVYQGDEFVYEVDTTTGRMRLVKHVPKLENQDMSKIKGVYAIVLFEDGTTKLEIMTKAQVESAWSMGAAKGKSKLHLQFTDQAFKKTVMNRAVKIEINSSDDSEVMGESTDAPLQAREQNKAEKANKKEISAENVDFEEIQRPETTQEQSEPQGPAPEPVPLSALGSEGSPVAPY